MSACTRCGKLVEGSVDESGMCLTCKIVMTRPPEIAPGELRVKRKVWPWLVGILVIAGAGVGAKTYLSHERQRENFEARYPIIATIAQEKYLHEHAKAWRTGKTKLVAAVAAIPQGEPKGSGSCPLSVVVPSVAVATADIADYPFRDQPNLDKLVRPFLVDRPDLATRVTAHVAQLLDAAERIRFQTGEGQYRILAAIGIPLIVVRLTSDTPPEIVRATTGQDSFSPGRRAGTAYVFDRASGSLRCAATFEAVSSAEITTSGYLGGGFDNAEGTLARDLDEQTLSAIQKSLVAVE